MKVNHSKFILITILTVLLLGLKSWPASLNARHENNSSIEENSKSVGNHGPISITGNDALVTFIEDEGLSGEGTSTSPYIIENFFINARYGHGIEIESTDTYLIIRDCTVAGGGYWYWGIWLRFVTNINVSNNFLSNNYRGISLSSSSNNILSWNTASYNTYSGIFLRDSNNNTLSRNTANNNNYGIALDDSNNNNTLSGNTASYNAYSGIYLQSSCNNNTLSGNNASYNNDLGIFLKYSSNNNTYYFNNIYGNTKGQAFEDEDCTDNHWDNGTTGNYWGDDYTSKYPSATNDGKIWNIPYEINGTGGGIDRFPLVNAVISPETTTTEDTTTTADTTTTESPTDDTTSTTTPSWNVLLLLLSFIAMLPLRQRKKK